MSVGTEEVGEEADSGIVSVLTPAVFVGYDD
jgi:hypothetical protein